MVSFVIYLIAGLTTGWQVFQLIMWAIWGAPTSPIQFVVLVGSWGLNLPGILAFKRKKASLIMAVFGLLGLWSFYVPVIYQTLHPAHDVLWEPTVFIAPTVLLGATIYFGLDLSKYLKSTRAEKPVT